MVTSNALAPLWENFSKLTPYAVGYDRIFDHLNQYVASNATAAASGFPPYNIRKEGEYDYVIEMALAGFGKEDIQVEVAESTLSIRSVKENPEDESMVHRGISFRKFNRKFTIADDIIVKDASLENGMLQINLERIVPEEKKPRLIEVK